MSIQREGRNVTALAVAPDGLLVYAQGYRDEYTDTDALFLRRTNVPTVSGTKTRAHGLFASTQVADLQAPASVTKEFHDVYFDFNLRPYTFAPWFSNQYLTDGTAHGFNVDTPCASTGAASLTVNVWSIAQADSASPDHALQVLINGRPAGQGVWSGGNKMMQLSCPIASGLLHNGANQIELVTPQLNDVERQISLLHSITVEYSRSLDGSKSVDTYNRGATAKLFEVGNVPSTDVWVVDARYPDRATLVPYETQAQADGTFKLRFNASAGGTGHYFVVPAGQENLPLEMSKRQVKPIKPAAYLAVGPSQFGPSVKPLLVARAKEGLRCAFVIRRKSSIITAMAGMGRVRFKMPRVPSVRSICYCLVAPHTTTAITAV